MAVNNLVPAFAKLYIQNQTGALHTMTTPLSAIQVEDPDPAVALINTTSGVNIAFSVAMDNLWDAIRPFHSTSTVIDRAELWKKASALAAPVFVTEFTAWTNPAGVSGAVSTKFGFITFTWRSTNGGKGIVRLVEPSSSLLQISKYQRLGVNTGLSAQEIAFRDNYLEAPGINILYARDNGVYLSALNVSHRISDTLRKRAMRIGEI